MQSASPVGLISRLEGELHASLQPYIPLDEPLATLDFPDIRNCGDSAIWLGEIAYLKRHYNKFPTYVSRLNDLSISTLKRQMPNGPIFVHGGGNFGDIWPAHQMFRQRVIEAFPDRQIVQFPQSIHFQNPKLVDATAKVIAKHGNFILFVRDKASKAFADQHFDCITHLCPDMAFAIGPLSPAAPKMPVLAMLREDKEKRGEAEAWTYADIPKEDWITEDAAAVNKVKRAAWFSALKELKPSERRFRMLDAAAHQRFARGINQISRAQAIVTDRLHVHICSLLLGRPHAVLDNNYGKISNFMDAFSGGSELSYRASSLDDGIEWARRQAASN